VAAYRRGGDAELVQKEKIRSTFGGYAKQGGHRIVSRAHYEGALGIKIPELLYETGEALHFPRLLMLRNY
jgi:hypothetical protein